ncbi:MAG: ABC transporter ATP-binding protein [Bacteroidales bacterium]|nr:ABC transporter ATP-binding protein [Bacteroidales bacterium]MCF8344420.1 ABC transporter ATP-binding protein [Bacteroidales bacterium]MCF8351207.1 ABC transporter ATP-binding protein [Bacteroidales bacterium]MCF8377660.1 ABC transporter ATP-binding protein [Bacteroidales bacterium]MCF8402060.1 ABC transporter ATP-binding protein [Bacteroidales bacterium]
MNGKKVIQADQLTKFYGQSRGIDNISFDVEQGEIFGFLGPNGAGKTTTIRILLDLLRPSSGEVRIFDRDVRMNSFGIRQRCGYLPGKFSAYHNLTGNQFLKLVSKIKNIPYQNNAELFRRLELSESDLNKKTKELSHGMLQKIGIIQAMMHQPGLLILDEPTTGLDPLMKEVFYELLLEEQQKGTTIFFSSHNLSEVEKLCTRVAIIRQGKVVGLETTEELKRKAGQMMEFQLDRNHGELEIPGAEATLHRDQLYLFRLTGDIAPVLKRLAELPVKSMSLEKPGLEDIFMNYYKDQKAK